jgi:hypothetical protein
MNELGGELAKPAGFDSGRLPAHYPRMMCLLKDDAQFVAALVQVFY